MHVTVLIDGFHSWNGFSINLQTRQEVKKNWFFLKTAVVFGNIFFWFVFLILFAHTIAIMSLHLKKNYSLMPNIHYYSLCRDDSYSDQVLERQADMIRYLKQHNVQLGKRLLALTEENSMLKANRWARHKKHWANQKESSIPGDCAMWYFLVNAVALTEWVNHAYIIYMYQCAKTLVLYHHILPSNRFLGTKHLLYSVLLCRHQYYILSLDHKSLPFVYCMDIIYTSVL